MLVLAGVGATVGRGMGVALGSYLRMGKGVDVAVGSGVGLLPSSKHPITDTTNASEIRVITETMVIRAFIEDYP